MSLSDWQQRKLDEQHTRPGEFRIPVKFGLYQYGQITHSEAEYFDVIGD